MPLVVLCAYRVPTLKNALILGRKDALQFVGCGLLYRWQDLEVTIKREGVYHEYSCNVASVAENRVRQ